MKADKVIKTSLSEVKREIHELIEFNPFLIGSLENATDILCFKSVMCPIMNTSQIEAAKWKKVFEEDHQKKNKFKTKSKTLKCKCILTKINIFLNVNTLIKNFSH